MKTDSMSTKWMLYCLSSSRNFAKQLLGKGKDYDALLKYWIETYGDVGGPYFSNPRIKDLIVETGMTYSVIRKQITKAYLDLVEDSTNNRRSVFVRSSSAYRAMYLNSSCNSITLMLYVTQIILRFRV